MIRRWIAAAILVGAVGACGPFCGNGKLNLSNAQINPTEFKCAAGAENFDYPINGTVDADNQSSKTINIKSMSDSAVVAKLAGGNWALSVGDRSSSDSLEFSPKSVGAGSKSTLKFKLPWRCTNPGGNTGDTYADFQLVLSVVTDSGNYKIDLPNHRMRMA